MRQTQLFTRTSKDAPKDEVAKNAQLLIRAGYVRKDMAGVYSYLPLGLRVLNKIIAIIRDEMNQLGGQEVCLTALQEKDIWEKTGRWDDKVVDNWFKTKLKSGSELGLAYTHEPAITALMRNYISSYRDLPFSAYQFQVKFRNELRAKSGLFRGREFMMKDLYSFSRSQEELDAFYERAIQSYQNIFRRVGIGDKTYLTLASGGTFGTKYSHEFQTLTTAGEDTIYIHQGKNIAINDEIYNDEALRLLEIEKAELKMEKSVEVGNIYKLGSFYSQPLELNYKDESGQSRPVIMGSYGIGLGRVMGTIVEVFADAKGLVWPGAVAPFDVHLIDLSSATGQTTGAADKLYRELSAAGIETLYDDREARAGEKFADSDLIGIPTRLVVSANTLAQNSVEVKTRGSEETQLLPVSGLVEWYRARSSN